MSTIWINRPRLKVRGYFGELSHDALSLNILAGRVWRAALLRGDVSGLVRYHFGANSSGLDWDDEKPPAIGLAYTLGFSDADNDPTAWALEQNTNFPATTPVTTQATTPLLSQLPNPFSTGKGLVHEDATINKQYTYRSPFTIAANRPFVIRLYHFKADTDDVANPSADLWEMFWDLWRLEVRGGSARLMRYNVNYIDDNGAQQPISYSQCLSFESQLETLLRLQTPSAADEEQMQALRRKIYEIDQPLSLRESSDLHRGSRGTTLTFLPSPSGYLIVETDSGARRHNGSIRGESIEIPSITSTRKPGAVWNASPLRIRTNGIAFEWQSGFPVFNYSGKLKISEYNAGFDLAGDGTFPCTGRSDLLPGTSIAFQNQTIKPDPLPPFVTIYGISQDNSVGGMFAKFTSDGTYSPFLFAANAYALPGARTGSDTVAYDTDAHLDPMGVPPILDVAPQYESSSRRSSCRVQMRRGQLLDGSLDLQTMPELTGRLIDILVKIDAENAASAEVPLFTKAIVKSEMWDDVQTLVAGDGTGAIATSVTPNAWTNGEIELSDPQQLLDDDLMEHQPIGDASTLWSYACVVLKDGGWRSDEMIEPDNSISYDLSRVLPSSQGNEKPCVQPAVGVSRGDFLRGLFDKYGMGRRFWWDNRLGKWRIGFPDTTVHAAFSTAYDTPAPYRIYNLSPITDATEFFNSYYVEGAKDPKTGQPIARRVRLYESIRNPAHPTYLGRIKSCPDVKDEGLRTPDDVNYVLRSLLKRYSRAGRFFQFTTDFIPNLYPLDSITINGKWCEIERIPSANLRDKGSMTIVARRLEF